MPAAAWVSFAQVGLKYLLWLAVMGLSLAVIDQRKRWRSTWRQPGPMLLLLWVGWMWISAWWSSAPIRDIIIHGWIYALPLGAIAIGAACPPAVAQRSLLHFIAASACVGGLWAVHSRGRLPVSPLWHSTLAATGNQRIMASVLLALGAVLACWFLARQTRPWPKVGLALAALLAAAGLISQDRRSGMVLLPLLLLVWALALPRPPLWRASGVLAVAVASPCTAPFMGASLGLAVTLPAAQALAVFAALGLGMALPYLAATAWPPVARAMPRPGVWMLHFKTAMAFPMLATVVWLVWVLGQQSGIDGAAALLGLLLALAFAAWALGSPTLGARARSGFGLAGAVLLAAALFWAAPVLRQDTTAVATAAAAATDRWQPCPGGASASRRPHGVCRLHGRVVCDLPDQQAHAERQRRAGRIRCPPSVAVARRLDAA